MTIRRHDELKFTIAVEVCQARSAHGVRQVHLHGRRRHLSALSFLISRPQRRRFLGFRFGFDANIPAGDPRVSAHTDVALRTLPIEVLHPEEVRRLEVRRTSQRHVSRREDTVTMRQQVHSVADLDDRRVQAQAPGVRARGRVPVIGGRRDLASRDGGAGFATDQTVVLDDRFLADDDDLPVVRLDRDICQPAPPDESSHGDVPVRHPHDQTDGRAVAGDILENHAALLLVWKILAVQRDNTVDGRGAVDN